MAEENDTQKPSREAVDPASAGSPLRVRYSLAEMEMLLKAWMVNEFGHPRDYITDPDQKDKWYRDYGLIYHFIRDHFPAENKEAHQPS